MTEELLASEFVTTGWAGGLALLGLLVGILAWAMWPSSEAALATSGAPSPLRPAPPPRVEKEALPCPRCGSSWVTPPVTGGQEFKRGLFMGALTALTGVGWLYVPGNSAWHCDYCNFDWTWKD